MSATLSFQVIGVDLVMAEVDRRYQGADEKLRELFEKYGIWTRDLTAELSPYDTGFMSSRVRYTPLGYGKLIGFTAGWHEEDFRAVGLFFYPVVQEFGSIFQDAQPSLGPAGRELFPELRRDAADTMRQTFRG